MAGFDIYVPTSLADALSYMEEFGEGTTVLARGTDLVPRLKRRQVTASNLLDLSGLELDLRYVRVDGGSLRIGALTTVSDLLESPSIGKELEVIRDAGSKFGDPQIRNVATVGGNVCSASSSEDLIPVLLALDAKLKLSSSKKERVVPLKEFILGKRTTFRKSGEILTEVEVPQLPSNSGSAYDKLGRRNTLIIALVNMAVVLTLEPDLETVLKASVSLNRVSGRIPQRATLVEGYLAGRRLTSDAVAAAQGILANELSLGSDFRASGEYRADVAKVFLGRLLGRCVSRIRGS